MNQKQKLLDNIAAIKVATNEGYSPYTEEERIEILMKWSGIVKFK